jgi:putative nucleotidyltransferase with HDIG domain
MSASVGKNDVPSVAEILSALSHALDLVEGQPRGHATRSAFIALRLAEELQLTDEERRNLLYGCLLKDAGCSDNSARIHKMFGGDDLITKNRVKLIDWSSTVESFKFAYLNMDRGGTVVGKLRRMVASLGTPEATMDSLTEARCTRGAQIALRLGFGKTVADAVSNVDEHWDGKGSPQKIKGPEIPILSRVINVAQTLEVFVSTFDRASAYEMLKMRNGRWFQPDLVKAAKSFAKDEGFWDTHRRHLAGEDLTLWDPFWLEQATPTDIDAICGAFADIVDAKSDFTGSHSSRVTGYTVAIAEQFGYGAEQLSTLRRAALLHDIGKLGISNAILDKPARLTEEEFDSMKQHPRFSYEILGRIKGFERITEIASAHHEKLNGRGYWRGIDASALDLDMRILSVADIYDALLADRPYRAAMPLEKVWSILDEEAQFAIDPDCVAAAKKLSDKPMALAA